MAGQLPKIYVYRQLVQAKLFIDEHYSANINLDEIADVAFFSKFHFTRLFKKTYDYTPHQYLTRVRIDRAKELLSSDMSITDTCFAVGFESISSFTALFKRYTGSTPSGFQQQKIKRKQEIATTPVKFVPNCFASQQGWTENSNFQ
ncbi:AraC family transcriptional regulator [Leptobacterium flavescens]|uniref:AraC family transcriptional regulator n=1 Tax=Leptobacterium flavescens TaxID=472055 RepID=A0A6P0UMX0_9FLAO|nr:AraC family transcriptional regulator [Leptobacterium flavescens]NER14721.1 AraC family transcriptional regulator [Leptobacterium flavescens]